MSNSRLCSSPPVDSRAYAYGLRIFLPSLLFALFHLPKVSHSAIPQIVIHWSTLTESGNSYRLQDRDGLPLDGGLSSNGDGALATLGYFDEANSTAPFHGDWIPLTQGTTVGDSSSGYGYDNGMFSFTTVFTKDSNQVIVYPNEPASYSVNANHVILSNAPPTNQPLCIRFYDRATTDASARYNTVTGLNWKWPTFSSSIPANLYLKIAPGSSVSKWKYGSTFEDSNSSFKTSLRIKARLQASVFGTGGSVSLNPNNADGMYEYDSNVTVTALADQHFEFVRWNGVGVTQPTSPTSTVLMTEDRNVTATFKVREYNVTITTVGTGTFSGVGVYPYDSNVSISATAGQGYEFSHWLNYDSLGNLTTGLDNNLTANTTLNVGGGHALVAVFNPLKYNITVNSTSGGSAQVVQQPGPYDFDGNYTLAASANYGHSFSNWTGDSNSIGLLPSVNTSIVYFLLTHPGNLSYTANFTENQYLLTVLYGTGGASVSPATPANYKHSDLVPISATALHGYEFDQWEDVNGSLVNYTQLNTDVNMSKNAADVTVRALFKAKQYDVNLTAGPGGQVTITPTTGPWEHFSVYPVLATPSTGYAFSGWTGDVNSTDSLTDGVSDANNSLAISGPVTLTANFALIDFNVTATVGSGSGNVTGSGTYTVNDTPQVVAVAGTGWHFTSWAGDIFALNSPSSLSSTINLLQHPQNLSLHANFARNTFDVNVTATEGGLVNGQSTLSLNPAYEDVIDLNATPSTGWEFDGWYGHANSNDWNASVSLSVTSNLDLNATFKRKDYALNIQSSANGQTSGEGSYPFESNVTIVATPNTGYLFSNWTGDVQYLADANSSTTIVTIPSSDVNIAPSFSPKTYQITVTSDVNGSATGGGSYTFGSIATLSAIGNGPDIGNLAGYEFSQWTLTNQAGGESNSSSNPLAIQVDGNYSVFASFTPIIADVHDLNLSVSPAGGGIVFDDPNLRAWNGGTLILTSTITATPNPGYSFLGWSNPDTKTLTPHFKSPAITFVTDSNASLVAQFVKNTVEAVARVSGDGTTQIESNETSLSLQATANTGYTFQNWEIDRNFTYAITVGNSSVDPSAQVFLVNGKESPSLILLKGYTYTFACNTGSDGFYFSSQIDSTALSNAYTHANLSGSGTTSGNLVFTVPTDFDTNVTLYYCSSQTSYAGNSVKVIDTIPDSTIIPFPTQAAISPSITHDLATKATFNLNQYLVTISAGNGGSLTQGTTGTYYHGESVSLSATPDAHYFFSHWEGTDFASASSATTSTTISSTATIQAVFTPVTYTLTLSKNIEAGGDVFTTTNVYQFNYNDTVTIQAQPSSGYTFLSWSNGMTNATEQITILGDHNISANFDGEPATLTHQVQSYDIDGITILQGVTGGFISVSANPPYKFGDPIEMTSHDEPGFQFDGWLDANGDLISSSRTLQLNLEANQTITAKFKKLSYEVKIFSAPLVGGTVKADRGTNSQIQTIYVPHGEQVNLQALASANYQFEKWVGNGLESANALNSQLELTVTQDISVTGHFIPLQPIELAIVIVPSEAGFAIGSGSFIYNPTHPIFATPNVGYLFDEWEGVGIEDSKSATTSILLNENKTIKAKFINDPNYSGTGNPTVPGLHSLQLIPSPTNAGSANGSGIYGTGWQEISATNQYGYFFTHWEADGVEEPNSASTRIFLTKNIQVTAVFKIITGSDLVSGSVQLGNSWWYSDWFGPFWHREGDLWVYHSVLGWMFMDPHKADLSVWFWVEFLDGWQWTSPSIWTTRGGFIHTNKDATWHYFDQNLSTAKIRYIYKYNLATGGGEWRKL